MRTAFVLLLLSVVVATVVANSIRVDDGATYWNVEFVNAGYDCADDITVFHYHVTSSSSAHVFRLVVGANCHASAVVPLGTEFTSAYGQVPQTSVSGFSGLKVGGTGAYELRLKGKWDPSALTHGVALLGDDTLGRYTVTHFNLPVPSFCATGVLFPACPVASDGIVDCKHPPTQYDIKVTSPICQYDASYKTKVSSLETADKTYSFDFNVVTSDDVEAPTFVSVPPNQVFEACSGFTIPPATNLTVTDNCSPDEEVSPCTHRENGTCPNEYIITYTWTAVDDCGQTKCVTTKYSVQDNTPPTISGLVSNDTIECGAAIPVPPTVTDRKSVV